MNLKQGLQNMLGRNRKKAANGPGAGDPRGGGDDDRQKGGRLRQEATERRREQEAQETRGKPQKRSKGPKGPRRTRKGSSKDSRKPVAAGSAAGGSFTGGYGKNGAAPLQPDGYSEGYEYGSGAEIGGPDDIPLPPGLGQPERIHSPKRSLMARVLTVFFFCAAFVGLLWLTLVAFYGFFGGSSGEASVPETSAAAARDAEALAEPFAAAYLTMNAGENPSALRARVSPFVPPDLITEVAGSGGESASRQVLATQTVKSTLEREGRWAVHTESVVETTLPEDDPDNSDNSDTGGGDADGAESESGFRGGEGGTTTVERIGLIVYVGQDEGEGIAVMAPPMMVAPRPPYEGEGGAIYGEDGSQLYDGPVKNLLEGYFAAAYGSDESRASLKNFVADGGTVPIQPTPGLEFISLKNGVIYPLSETDNPDWKEPYDVAAYVDVRDTATGGTYTQTHLLRVAETPDGWKVVGGRQSVASGSASGS